MSCSDDGAGPGSENLGSVQLAVTGGESHDVTQFEFKIVEQGGNCASGNVIASSVVALEEESLPANLGGGDMHAFADSLFVLPPDDYVACASPLQSDLSPSAKCAPASANVTVTAELTTEVVLVSQCQGDENGAVDVVASLNDPPRIDDLDITPSKFITVCQQAGLAVTASDVNNDTISYSWLVVTQPGGSNPVLTPAGATATFDTDMVGDYEVTVTATDEHAATTSLTFPIHVSPGNCDWLVAGGGSAHADIAHGIAADPNGDIIGWGMLDSSSITLGGATANNAGGRDVFAVKLSPDGQTASWIQSFGTAGNDETPLDMAVDANGDIFVTGVHRGGFALTGCPTMSHYGNEDTFVAKLSGATGTCLWSHSSGGSSNEKANSIAVDAAGNVVVAGITDGSITIGGGGGVKTGGGGLDTWYAKFDGTNGNHIWSYAVGASGTDGATDVAIMPSGDIVIAGTHDGAFNLPGPVLVGHPGGGTATWVARVSGTTGDAVWTAAPNPAGNAPGGLAVDSAGNVFLGGTFSPTINWGGALKTEPAGTNNDVYVVKFSSAGVPLWTQQGNAVSTTINRIEGLAVDNDDNVRVVGFFDGTINWGTPLTTTGDRDVYVVELAGGSGVELSVRVGAGAGTDEANGGISIDPSDNSTLVAGSFGYTGQTFTFGGGTGVVSNNGGYDVYFARLLQ